MTIWSLERLLAAWAAMSVLNSVFSSEVTVRDTELKLCQEDRRMCVRNLADCSPPCSSSVQKSLNMSCYYQSSAEGIRSMTCVWSQESTSRSEASLIFSRPREIKSCRAIFNPISTLSVTARIKDVTGEICSQPHTVLLYQAVKPSQPVLTVLGSAEDSLVVSWGSSENGNCHLRYRLNSTHMWTQAPDYVPVLRGHKLNYTIRDLLPCSVYRAAVACSSEYGVWSDWSSDVSGKTHWRAPSKPPDMCYRVEKPENTSGRSVLLHLMWKAPCEAGCPVLGYQVNKEPGGFLRNFTERTAILVAEERNCSVAVRAFNTAGYGPPAHLRIDTKRQNTLPSIRSMWVSSFYPDKNELLIQWEPALVTSSSVLPGSQFVIQLHSEKNPSTSLWAEVRGFNTVIQVPAVVPDESFLISVSPISKQQCGRPRFLSASLQHGALMEAVALKIVGVNRTTVTVECVWLKQSGRIRVNRYRATLRTNSGTGNTPSVFLWPHQTRHTFFNLTPNTQYSLLLLADNVSRAIVPVKTESDELPAVATVTPLLLLAVTVLIISILSRTVYKSYFVSHISSPQGSTTGKWLMDANLQKSTKRHILDIHDFQVTDVLGEKSLIVVSPNRLSFEEGLHKEDSPPLSMGQIAVKLSMLKLDTDCVCDAPQISEYQLVRMHEANSQFPQDKGENENVSHQTDTAVKCHLDELLSDSRCVHQMTCEAEYLVNSPLQGKTEVQRVSGQSDCSYLICEAGYIDNSCFRSIAEDKD